MTTSAMDLSPEVSGSEVSGPELMAHIREFAKRVKLSGTPEELESFRYLERVMRGNGYRTRLLMHDAYISLPGAAEVVIGNQPMRAITHSFSQASPAEGLGADLVYLGRGTEADFAGTDARGRIVLVDGISSPDVSHRASRAGAVGEMHISPGELLYEMCVSPVWGSPSAASRAALPTTVVTTISQTDGATLRTRLASGEALRARLRAEVDTGWRETPLLVADLEGPDPDGPFVLFSGHHDTWHLGVMDNGGANATMLEIARLCASRRGDWRRGLRLCFWSGHSHGRYSGSAWYADTHWDELERNCVAHVNVDSTGAIGATVLKDTASMSVLHALAAEAIAAEAGQEYVGRRKNRSSDDSFGGIGIPSMFGALSEQVPSSGPATRNNLGWWWHTPEDTIDKIDEAHLIRDTRVVLHVVRRLLGDALLPLDVAAEARDLRSELENLAPSVRDVLGVDALLKRAASIESIAIALRDPARSDAATSDQINRALVLATRALVPIDYTSGDRFGHDPAMPVPAWPTLQAMRDLAAAEAGTDAARFLKVAATRARNRVAFALREAEGALRAALA
jgi:Peptidase family M28